MIKNLSEVELYFVRALTEGIGIIDFFTNDCSPCKIISKSLHNITNKDSSIKMIEIDAEENEEMTKQFEIMGVPAVFIFKNGELMDSFTGVIPQNQIEEKIARLNNI